MHNLKGKLFLIYYLSNHVFLNENVSEGNNVMSNLTKSFRHIQQIIKENGDDVRITFVFQEYGDLFPINMRKISKIDFNFVFHK